MESIQYVGVKPTAHIQEIVDTVENRLFERLSKFLTDNEPNRYYTAEQICERFSITKPTIHEYRKRKIIKSYRLGSRVYYRLDEIENAMIIND